MYAASSYLLPCNFCGGIWHSKPASLHSCRKFESLRCTQHNHSSPCAFLTGQHSQRVCISGPAGIQAALKKHNGSARLSLHFKADESGLMSLEKGEAVSEISEEYTTKVPLSPPSTPFSMD